MGVSPALFLKFSAMPIRRTRYYVPLTNQRLETEIFNLEKPGSSSGLYELHENSATYGVKAEMLNNIKNYFRSNVGNDNKPCPTLLLWYKGLSCDERKTVMIIGKERTENDR
jgi:hypothetical protein